MIILTLRTDKPEAEIGFYEDGKELVYEKWQAHRLLAETIHVQIATKLQFVGKDWGEIGGIVVYKGPGSFTGLRIGMSVANALAYSLGIPIVAAKGKWIESGIGDLLAGKSDAVSLPEYGSPLYVSKPKK